MSDETNLETLIGGLGAAVNPGEPAAVAGMGMVPADGVFQPSHALGGLNVLSHVLVALLVCIDSGLRAFNGQSEGVHDDHHVAVDLAQEKAHHLNIASGSKDKRQIKLVSEP